MKLRAFVLALIAWACIAAPAQAAWSVTNLAANGNTFAGATSSMTTGSITIPANALGMVGGTIRRNATTPVISVADSAGNNWTVIQCTSVEAFAPWITFVAYFRYAGTGLTAGTITATEGAGSAWFSAAMSSSYATGHLAAGTVEDSAGRGCPGTPAIASTSPSVTSGTPGASGNLAFGITGRLAGGTSGFSYTADAANGWTALGGTGNTNTVENTAYAINSGSSAIILNPTMNNQTWTQQIVQFFIDTPAGGTVSGGIGLRGVGN